MENVYEDNNNNTRAELVCTIIGFIDIIDSLYSVGLLTELHDAYVLIRLIKAWHILFLLHFQSGTIFYYHSIMSR
jgi:hypothetical protein